MAIYKISQIARAKQIARRWHKLATTGIMHALSMKQQRPRFSYHYAFDDQIEQETEEILLRSSDDLKTSAGVPGDVAEGHLAVYAVKDEERLARFVIPVGYLQHPFFMKLLEKAEDEFGFNYRNGGLSLPCEASVLGHIIHLLERSPHHYGQDCSVDTGYQLILQSHKAGCSAGTAAWDWPDPQCHTQATTCSSAIDMKGKSIAVY